VKETSEWATSKVQRPATRPGVSVVAVMGVPL
jgi:hypothetical protein